MKIKRAHGNSLRLPLNEFLHLYNQQQFPFCFVKNIFILFDILNSVSNVP